MTERYWMGNVGSNDDFNEPIDDVFYDGRTVLGPWAIMRRGLGVGSAASPDQVTRRSTRSRRMAAGSKQRDEKMSRHPDWDDHDYDDDRIDFADPGGKSALRAATKDNPRNLPCPNCGKRNRLTPADRARGYQCDKCADRAEAGID